MGGVSRLLERLRGPESLRRLARLMPRLSVLDVGANRGDFYQQTRAAGLVGPYFAIEPDPALATLLSDKFAAIEVLSIAIGETDGRQRLHRYSRPELNSFLELTEASLRQYDCVPLEPVDVETWSIETLGHYVMERCSPAQPFLLKLDTQGFDQMILRHLTSPFLEQVRAIQTEVAIQSIYRALPSWAAHLDLLSDLGFEPFDVHPVSRDAEGRLIELDVLAIRPNVRGDRTRQGH